MENCPCGSNTSYETCCSPYIKGEKVPSTPEILMRSRYTAYTQADTNYIARTMKAPASDHFDIKAARDWAKQVTWLKLEITNTVTEDKKGFVEFEAHFTINGKRQLLNESSEFHLINGTWYYIDGADPAAKARLPANVTRIGRNEPCLCNSGVKYKKCCGK